MLDRGYGWREEGRLMMMMGEEVQYRIVKIGSPY